MDGSEHDWFEGRGPRAADQLAGQTRPLTQFERAMRILGVGIVTSKDTVLIFPGCVPTRNSQRWQGPGTAFRFYLAALLREAAPEIKPARQDLITHSEVIWAAMV